MTAKGIVHLSFTHPEQEKDFLQAVIDRLPDNMLAELHDGTGGCFATVYHVNDEGIQPCALLDADRDGPARHDGMTAGWYDQSERVSPSDDPDVVAMYVMLLVERQSTMSDRELRVFDRTYAPDS